MNEKRSLSYLVDKIATQTKLDPKIIKLFLNHFFKGLEKELIESSAVKINDLGIFRMIKSLSGDRILFLGKFKTSDSLKMPLQEKDITPFEMITDSNETTPPEIIPNRSETDVTPDKQTEATQNTYKKEVEETVEPDSINDHVELHEDKTEFTGFGADKETEKEIDNDIYFYDYENENKKKIRTGHIMIGLISSLILITILGLLYFIYMPPKTQMNYHNYFPEFSEIENSDTANIMQVIEAESNIDFLILSKKYYNSEIFWPYIYQANPDIISDSFIITSGTIVKIPKIDKKLIDITDESCIMEAKKLANEIINKQHQLPVNESVKEEIRMDSVYNQPKEAIKSR